MAKVSIVVTTFLKESKPYLDLCMRSIKNLSFLDHETILVSPESYIPTYDGVKNLAMSGLDYSNSDAINAGFAATDKSSKYIFYLNDDVILTKSCLSELVLMAETLPDALLMPISNDQQLLFSDNNDLPSQRLYFARSPLPFPYRYNEVKDIADEIINLESFYPPAVFFYNQLCTYAMLISRRLYDTVGPMDTSFVKAGPDDVDFCRRAREKGFLVGVLTSALAFHAGGASSEKTLTPADRAFNAKAYERKYREPTNQDLRDMDFIGE